MLDGAVLVVSAVEGVQAQTRVLMRTLQRLRIPTLLFVNKIDRRRRATDPARVAERLTPASCRWARRRLGTRAAGFARHAPAPSVLADHDDALLAAYLEGAAVPADRLRADAGRADRARRRASGVLRLGDHRRGRRRADRRHHRVPARAPCGDADGPVSGTRVQGRARPGGREGRLRADVLRHGPTARAGAPTGGGEAKVTGDQRVRAAGAAATRPAGRARSAGSGAWARCGSATRSARPRRRGAATTSRRRRSRRSSCRADAADRGALHLALTQLAEQDPLINLRQDDVRRETSVSLYGEVQKEVIQATLADEFGVEVDVPRDDDDLHRAAGRHRRGGRAIGKGGNPFLATVGPAGRAGPGRDGRVPARGRARARCRTRSSARSRRPCARRCAGPARLAGADCTVTMTHCGLLAAPEQRARHVRQEHVEHRRATSAASPRWC